MTRPTKRRSKTALVDWKPEFGELFRMVFDDWKPPAKVHLTDLANGGITVAARFVMPSGTVTTVRVRLRKDPRGRLVRAE